jgi:mannose-6-phosphate isomerase
MPVERLSTRALEKLWGSTRLSPWFPDSPRKIGEVWFERAGGLPLLVKFLFTTEKLSVQVHPNDEYARRHENSLGKTEMWHILAAEPGAQIAAGFRERVSAGKLREAAVSGEIMDLLAWHDARPGDTFFIPAGTVHAIGEGLVLCEIQQHSDITYRLYDYGRPRELHLDRGLEVSHLGPCAARQEAREGTLVSCDYFTTEKIRIDGTLHHTPPADRPELWIVVEGAGKIAGEHTRAGEAWHIIAGSEPFSWSGRATVLRVRPGPET